MTLGLPAYLETKIIPEPNSGCWLWEAGQSQGYGYVWLKGQMLRVHRVVYELLVGHIPRRLELDHKCRVRCCCNPEHLEPVTKKVNLQRGVGVGAMNALKTHCPKGHSLKDAYTTSGKRQCRTCAKQRALRYHRKGKL